MAMPFLSSVLGSFDSLTCPTQDHVKRLPNHNCHTHYNPLEDRTTKKIMPERERERFMADSCSCVAEPNAILQSNYPPIRNLKRKNTISIIQSHNFKYHLCAANPPPAPSCILITYANSLRDPSHWISHKPLQCIFTQN